MDVQCSGRLSRGRARLLTLISARRQVDLSSNQQAGVSKRTIERLETGAVAAQLSGFIRVCRVLDVLERFDALIPEPVPSPLELLKLRGRQRRRAPTAKAVKAPAKKWQWGNES